jgi:predicted N-acetyltransferase YhbS
LYAPEFAPEAAADASRIERVLDRAFGPGRFAKPSERVRESASHNLALSRVARLDGALIACCRIYDVSIGARPALFLGPLAVDPDAQHHGLGHRLVRETIEACRAGGGRVIILMGEPSFFSVLGFVRAPAARVRMPVPAEARRLQWLALVDGGLDDLEGPISPPRAASRA